VDTMMGLLHVVAEAATVVVLVTEVIAYCWLQLGVGGAVYCCDTCRCVRGSVRGFVTRHSPSYFK